MNNNQFRLTLLGLALGILLALLIVPQTRWLVRAQLFPERLTSSRYEQQKEAFVRQHPSDYQVQLAGQPEGGRLTQVQYERSLVSRFPQNASLRANILRYATLKEVQMRRNEDFLLEGQSVPPHPDPSNPPPTAAALAAFDADAATGECLDSDNAYFPFMRAFGLFAAHRDAEGLAAVQRASTKHLWQDYSSDEVKGGWRINRAVYGGQEAVSASAVSASLLFPHYQQLRAVARIVVYKAILDEQSGHFEAGLAKRNAIGRCGEIMALRSTILIGNLVGIAINSISRSRPGGTPPLRTNLPGEEQAQKRLALYCTYVVKIGHPEAAAQARSDFADWQQIRRATSHIEDLYFGVGMANVNRLVTVLIVGWLIFSTIFVLLALGLMVTALSRLPRVQARQPLPAGAMIGFWGIVVIGAGLTAVYFDAGPVDFPIYVPMLLLPPLLFTAFSAGFRPRLRRPIGTALLTAGVTLGLLGLSAAVLSWRMQGGMELITTMRQTLGLSGTDANGNPSPTDNLPWLQIVLGGALAVPLLTAIILSVVSRIKRVPASVGLVQGFRAVMPPLVCGLMLVYGGLTLWTIRQEGRANYGLERSLHGEGQYLAQQTGLVWPVIRP